MGWFAAIAAVVGAVLTERLFRREDLPANATTQLSVAAAAALGATVVAPLSMQPARAAQFASIDPVWAVGICAILGAVVGAGAALAVLLRPPLGWNVALTAGTIWLIALISVVPSLATTGPLPTVRLGVLEPSWLDREAAQRLAMLILPAVGLLAARRPGRWPACAVTSRWSARLRSRRAGADRLRLPDRRSRQRGRPLPDRAVLRCPDRGGPRGARLDRRHAGALAAGRWPCPRRTRSSRPTSSAPLPTGPAPIGATTTGSPADGGTPGDEPGSVDLIRPRTDAVDPASGVGGPRRDPFQDNRGDRLGGTATPHTVPAHWDWPPASGTGSPVPTGPSLAPLTVPSVAGPPGPGTRTGRPSIRPAASAAPDATRSRTTGVTGSVAPRHHTP
ncbi:hypothetical protein JNW88_17015, partial [Micromonospora sp. ATA32]|nr:hypothetical protein [Micromonospora sp. ATA32]